MRPNKLCVVVLMGAVCWWTVLGFVGEAADVTEQPQRRAEGKDVIDLVKDVDTEWIARCKRLGSLDPKLALGTWGSELKAVIGKRIAKDRMHDYMLVVTAAGPNAAVTGYHRSAVIQTLVDIYTKAGERAELVEMLSRDFPKRMYYSDVEFWLAVRVRDTFPNGIEVLFDAFERSKDPKVKEKIAASVARAFRANGLDFGKSEKTVDACRSWYAKNKGKIEPSTKYGDNIMHPGDPYARNGLFVSKEIPVEIPRTHD